MELFSIKRKALSWSIKRKALCWRFQEPSEIRQLHKTNSGRSRRSNGWKRLSSLYYNKISRCSKTYRFLQDITTFNLTNNQTRTIETGYFKPMVEKKILFARWSLCRILCRFNTFVFAVNKEIKLWNLHSLGKTILYKVFVLNKLSSAFHRNSASAAQAFTILSLVQSDSCTQVYTFVTLYSWA